MAKSLAPTLRAHSRRDPLTTTYKGFLPTIASISGPLEVSTPLVHDSYAPFLRVGWGKTQAPIFRLHGSIMRCLPSGVTVF